MKDVSAQHTFNHPWETVTKAFWQKYPNPMNPNVVGLDVVDRKVDNGILKTHRILSTEWSVIPSWVVNFIGVSNKCYVSEHSEVDPQKKVMKLVSRNLTLCNMINVEECMEYVQHPEDPNRTLLQQHSTFSIQNIPWTSYLENCVGSTCIANAKKGRQAMEWVIDRLKSETTGLCKMASDSMDSVTELSPPHVHCQADNAKCT